MENRDILTRIKEAKLTTLACVPLLDNTAVCYKFIFLKSFNCLMNSIIILYNSILIIYMIKTLLYYKNKIILSKAQCGELLLNKYLKHTTVCIDVFGHFLKFLIPGTSKNIMSLSL